MRPADPALPDHTEERTLREEFANEIATRNLRWIWWLTVISTGLLLTYATLNVVVPTMRSLRLLVAHLVDIGVTVVVLAVLVWLRRQPPTLRARRWFAVGYVLIVFAIFDHYHLSALARAGETGAYILGVVAVGVIVLLPPRVFLPLLLGNHALYLWLVVQSGAPTRVQWLAAMDGSAGVLVSGVAAWLLFTARWSDFRRERLLARTNAELARANAEMNDLMAIAAHDLRSPLEGVRRMLGVLRTRTEWGRAQIEKAVDTCLESCGGMVNFVGRLLDAHAVEAAAARKLTLVERDLRDDCTEAVERARAAAGKKGLSIALTLPEGPALARTEAMALAQVIDNLLGNAIKFSPPNVAVECTLGAGDHANWRIEVRDAGPGVRPEEQADLFQKFHRGSARPTAGESSSGLGLFIVKTLVDAMGGRVNCGARDNGATGAVFRVELPRT